MSSGFTAQTPHLSPEEKLARLRLIRTENVGPVTFRHLLSRYKTATAALEALPELAARGGRKKPLVAATIAATKKEMDAVQAFGGHLIVWGDEHYPLPLSHIDDAPPVLIAKGHLHLLQKDSLAVVGARNASAVGLKMARTLSERVGQAGYVISSGMARGIDGAVHKAALPTGTIAVLAGGADVIYPQEHRDLYEQICEIGLILSEMPLGIQPQARHFPRRNRIISGLSLGTLVVEATYKSGSLITARQALQQGREVFAIPGSPMDPRAKGPNELIRQGALLTESADDILQTLSDLKQRRISDRQFDLFDEGPEHGKEPDNHGPALDQARSIIRGMLSPVPIGIDELVRETELTVSTVLTIILEMELAGDVIRTSGNRVAFT